MSGIMMSSKRVAAAFAFALLAAFANDASAKKIDAAKLDAIKRVGVISVSGDTLLDRRLGITVFGNAYEEFDVSEWGLDAEWQSQLEEAVTATGKFEIISLTTDHRSALLASFGEESKTGEALRAVAETAKVDALLVFSSPLTDLYTRELYLERYGIFGYKAAFKKQAIYYLSGRLYLFDVSGKTIDTQYLPANAPKGLGPIPHRVVPEELEDVSFSDYTPEQKGALRKALIEIPQDLWAPALEKLLETK